MAAPQRSSPQTPSTDTTSNWQHRHNSVAHNNRSARISIPRPRHRRKQGRVLPQRHLFITIVLYTLLFANPKPSNLYALPPIFAHNLQRTSKKQLPALLASWLSSRLRWNRPHSESRAAPHHPLSALQSAPHHLQNTPHPTSKRSPSIQTTRTTTSTTSTPVQRYPNTLNLQLHSCSTTYPLFTSHHTSRTPWTTISPNRTNSHRFYHTKDATSIQQNTTPTCGPHNRLTPRSQFQHQHKIMNDSLNNQPIKPPTRPTHTQRKNKTLTQKKTLHAPHSQNTKTSEGSDKTKSHNTLSIRSEHTSPPQCYAPVPNNLHISLKFTTQPFENHLQQKPPVARPKKSILRTPSTSNYAILLKQSPHKK